MRICRHAAAIILSVMLLLASFALDSPHRSVLAQTPAPPQATPTVPAPQTTEVVATPDDEVERVETNLVNVLFNAVDKNRRFVTTLRQEDVRIFENNESQTVSLFQRETDVPLTLAILVDVSGSQEKTLPDEKEAAHIFIDSVIRPGKDAAAVVSFTGFATIEQDLTDDRASLHRAIERLSVAPEPVRRPATTDSPAPTTPSINGDAAIDPRQTRSTAIWDAIWATSGEMLAHTPARTRRAIILLSDGKEDSDSPLKKQDAIDAAIRADAIIFSIGIGDDEFDEGALKKISERTGGRAFFPENEIDLNAAFAQIEQELRTQYLLAYSPTNRARDGSFRQLKIDLVNPELRRQKLKLTYRNGYFARSPAPANYGNARPAKARLPKPPRPKKK
ncbi:MAG: VWA domain-containing protein [Pyrinomonadaceae bacterium]